jgi:hypothetical protein
MPLPAFFLFHSKTIQIMFLAIFIADTIRHGQYPRIPNFQHNNAIDKYLYLGRELSVEEFNQAANEVFSPDFRNEGFTLRPVVLTDEQVAAISPCRKAREEAEQATSEQAPAPPADAPSTFTMSGKRILMFGVDVAGLYGEGDSQHVRVKSEHADLRPQIEAWLSTQQP